MTRKEKIKAVCTALVIICVFLALGVCGACENGNLENGACFAAVSVLLVTALVLQKVAEVLTAPKTAKKEPPVLPTQSGPEMKKTNNTIIARKVHEINTKNTF